MLSGVHGARQADQAGHAPLGGALLAVAVAAQDLGRLGAVDHRTVTAELLRRVERLVRGLQQGRRGGAVCRVGGDAERNRQREDVLREVLAHLRAQALRQDVALVLVRLGEDQCELLPTHAAHTVDSADPGRERLAEELQRAAAGWVAEAVVQLLEVVQVAHQEREGRLEPPRALDLELERLLESAPVQQPREWVGLDGVAQALDQGVEAILQQPEESGGDDERAERDRPLRRRILDGDGEVSDRGPRSSGGRRAAPA